MGFFISILILAVLYQNDENFNKICIVELTITPICNYKCSYCHWITDTEHFLSFEDRDVLPDEFDRVIKFIELQDKDFLDFHFYGGEPTINKNLIRYIDILFEKFTNPHVSITSNLSRQYKYLKTIDHRVEIYASLHTDYVNTVEKIDKWFEKAMALETVVECRLMLQNNNLELIKYAFNKYKDLVNIEVAPISQIRDKAFLSDIERAFPMQLTGNMESVYTESVTSFKNMICVKGFTIRENGDLHKCWASMSSKPLMNLFKDSLKKIPCYHICQWAECGGERRHNSYSLNYFAKNKEEILAP